MRALHPVCRHYAFLSKRVIHTSTTAPTKATMIDPIIPRRARFPACQRPDLRRCKSPRWPETRLWEAKYEALGVLSATLTLLDYGRVARYSVRASCASFPLLAVDRPTSGWRQA